MDQKELYNILKAVSEGGMSPETAVLKFRQAPFEDIGFANVDFHRSLRQGVNEVIFGEGKTPEQIKGIINTMKSGGCSRILITRLSEEKAGIISEDTDIIYNPAARTAVTGDFPEPDGTGTVLVMTAGTSDIPVAEEAAVTAEFLGNRVERIYDVGVAGIHRLLSHTDKIMKASVIIAIAGMEGALASVVGGLADCPVIAVPTSVGYGASFGGVTALLSMLNSCASGVSVVNIDNGFGAAYQASMINHIGGKY